MGTVSSNDVIFATLSMGGRMIANLRLCGVSSLADIYGHVKDAMQGRHGLVTVRLRNSSQGWQHERALLVRRPVA